MRSPCRKRDSCIDSETNLLQADKGGRSVVFAVILCTFDILFRANVRHPIKVTSTGTFVRTMHALRRTPPSAFAAVDRVICSPRANESF